MMPIETASEKLKSNARSQPSPTRYARKNVAKIPNCAAAPRKIVYGRSSSEPKSIIAPTRTPSVANTMPIPASTNQVASSTAWPAGSAHDDGERVSGLDRLAGGDVQRLQRAADGRHDGQLHLERFHDEDAIALGDRLPRLGMDAQNLAGRRRFDDLLGHGRSLYQC